MDQVVEITNKARSEIQKIFQAEPSSKALRLAVVGGGCSGLSYKMDFDEIKEKDKLFEYEGFKMVIDLKSSIYLKGVVLDFEDGLNGKGFVFKNPNAKNTCGCGESFSV